MELKKLELFRSINTMGITLRHHQSPEPGLPYYTYYVTAFCKGKQWYLSGFKATVPYRIYPRVVIVEPVDTAMQCELMLGILNYRISAMNLSKRKQRKPK